MNARPIVCESVRPDPPPVGGGRCGSVCEAFAALLLESGRISRHDLDVAREHADRAGASIVDAVGAMGFVPEADSYATFAQASDMPLVALASTPISPLALRLLPERTVRRHEILPLQEDNRTLTYAIARPVDDETERDVAFASGRRPQAVLARRSELMAAIDRHYPRMGEIERIIARIHRDEEDQLVVVSGDPASEAPIIALCNQILLGALDQRASDVHLEPAQGGLAVRYRVGGVLDHVLALPRDAAQPVVNRFKILARADIAMRQLPQDGAFQVAVGGRTVDVRLSIVPTVRGEKVAMRIIDSEADARGLDRLGYDPETLARLARALARPDGLVLATGPTGSGKTTALYAALDFLRTGHTNIVSVEDPVERRVEGVNQIAAGAKGGTPFAAVLRSVLRQDPNVIMVGEIRDAEVAQIVGEAAYTGHLVLSSLHTGDAASAIARLRNLGLEPFRIAESLSAIVAQRLVRQLCPDCRVWLPADEASRLGSPHGIDAVAARPGPGCSRCRRTGFIERVPVAEILVPDDQMRAAILQGASASTLRAAMHAGGCRSMRETALAMVAEGITSLDEVNRVVPDDEAGPRRAGKARRVAVVDDDPTMRLLLRLLLEREGFEVLEGENGEQAVAVVRRERPELLVIDLTMPGLDGYEAIGAIRRELSLARLPVIVLTAENGPGIQQRVLELGADDYLVKPFDAGVLLARVRAALRRSERLAA